MAGAVNLSNVNISLAQFQSISSGKYNAGEVTLASENKLGKVNHHVHFTSFNKKAISHEEVLAIKNAFVRALEGGGVDKEAINGIRTQLGLKPDGTADKTLAQRSVKPLSRQEIREILDKNATALNATLGGDRPVVRTSGELYARVGQEEMDRRAHKREGAAAAAATRRSLDAGSQIALFQDTLGGNVHFHSADDAKRMLDFAIRQRDLIFQQCGGNPSKTGEAMVACQLDSGQNVNLSAGCSEADLLKRLDERIILLSNSCGSMSDEDVEARDEFQALATSQARTQWLDRLEDDPEDRFKARTAVVAMLAERGIDDMATLMHVNYLSGKEAVALAKQLANADPALRGDALRNDPIVIGLAVHPEPDEAHAVHPGETAYIPLELTTKDFNEAVSSPFTGVNMFTLPPDFHQMAVEVRDEMTRRFGEAAMPPNQTIDNIANKTSDIRDFCLESTARNERITPEKLRGKLAESAARNAALRFATHAVTPFITEAGGNARDLRVMLRNALIGKHPDLEGRLMKCDNPASAQAIIDEYAEEIRDMTKRLVVTAKLEPRFPTMVADAFRRELGIPGAGASIPGVDFKRDAEKAFNRFKSDLAGGKIPGNTPEEWEAACLKAAEAAARKRAEAMRSLDGLPGDPAAADKIRMVWMSTLNVPKIDIADIRPLAEGIEVGRLADLLAAKEPDRDAVYAEMERLNRAAHENLLQLGAEKNIEIDGDLFNPVNATILLLAVGRQEGLLAKIDAFFGREDVDLADFGDGGAASKATQFAFGVRTTPEDTEALVGSIGGDGMHPVAARALLQACDDARIEGLDDAAKFALFAPGGRFGDELRARLAGLPAGTPVYPATIRSLAADVLAPH